MLVNCIIGEDKNSGSERKVTQIQTKLFKPLCIARSSLSYMRPAIVLRFMDDWMINLIEKSELSGLFILEELVT